MIGIFDSGSGGLSVYREIVKLLPNERYIYYADNAHCPYGEKSRQYIIDRAESISSELTLRGCDIIVVACNTATAAAISTLREKFEVPFIGMEPAVKPAANITRTGVIGVLATASTLKAGKYLDTKNRYSSNISVIEHIGQGFVELVESGMMDGPQTEATVRRSLEPLLNKNADVIVLGCTHYPFLMPVIRRIAGPGVTILDPAPAAAKHLKDIATSNGLIHRDGNIYGPDKADVTLLSSGPSDSMNYIFSLLFQ